MENFLDKYLYPLLVLVTLVLGGYVLRFELLAGEVKKNTSELKHVKNRQNLVAWLMCKDAIDKGTDEAKERCKEVLAENKKGL